MSAFLLASLLVAHVPGDRSAPGWVEALEAAGRVVSERPESERGAERDARWRDFARTWPVAADWLLQDLGADAPGLLEPERRLELARRVAAGAGWSRLHDDARAALQGYDAAATARRARRLGKALAEWGPIAFTESHTVHMSFIGYTEGLSDARAERFFKPGSRLALLEFAPGAVHGAKRVLLDDPHGMLRDVDLSFDREELVFAWKRSDRLDDYHIHELRLADGSTRQLTSGLGRADYEPACLPDGDIVFTSTRPEQSVPCWWTEISNLYRMDGDGRHMRRLAVDQVHALHPALLSDGRIAYTRWDYNDRGQNFPHPVFSMRPDGQDQRVHYGGNSWFPTSLLHTRGVPGSTKSMSIAAGHHTLQQGKLVLLDTAKGRDEGVGMEFIAPRRHVPYERVDVAMQDGELFRHPFPLSETQFYASYRPAFGMERFGLYWMDADGARELLHADPELDVARMVPLGRKPVVPTIADTVDHSRATGTYYVHDVYRGKGLEGVPRGAAKSIRVVELDYRAAGVGQTFNHGEGGGSLNSAPVAVANGTWDVKRILGDADIHEDGSALFEVPAMASIYLQVLDDKGRAIQTTRSWDTLRPGEQKGCVGCHEKQDANAHPFADDGTMAWKHGVQRLRPFQGPPRGFSFAREVQPILDANCVACHDGSEPGTMDLRGTPVDDGNINKRRWTRSYLNLVEARRGDDGNWHAEPESGLVSWISKMSRPTELPPYFAGSARSRLLAILDAGHHGVALSPEEDQRLAAWMDLLVPFSGDYWEGNAWNEHEKAYYRYYEAKREHGAREETARIAAYMAEKAGKPAPGADLAAPKWTTARYREVLGEASLVRDGATWRLPAGAVRAWTDQLWLANAGGDQPRDCVVRVLAADGRELARLRLSADGAAVHAHLGGAVRGAELRFDLEGEGVAARLVRALGVEHDDVPRIDGYHPHLGRE